MERMLDAPEQDPVDPGDPASPRTGRRNSRCPGLGGHAPCARRRPGERYSSPLWVAC